MTSKYNPVLSSDYDKSQPYRTLTLVRCDDGSIALKEVEYERFLGAPFVGEYRYEQVIDDDDLSYLDDFTFEE